MKAPVLPAEVQASMQPDAAPAGEPLHARLATSAGPLTGVRVIDLTVNVLGPVATMILGDMGADVIKIETPDGDPNRQNGPSRNPNMAAMHLNMNRNLKSRLSLHLRELRSIRSHLSSPWSRRSCEKWKRKTCRLSP